jgi:hypothetical protein
VEQNNMRSSTSLYVFFWDMGSFANSEIDALFEINYSLVSRRAETMKVRIHEDRAIKGPVATLKSQIKM